MQIAEVWIHVPLLFARHLPALGFVWPQEGTEWRPPYATVTPVTAQGCGLCHRGHPRRCPLTSLPRRLLLLRRLRRVVIVAAVSEPHGAVAPVLRERFAQPLVFFLLNKNENFINKNRNLLRKSSYISKVVAISWAYNTLFSTSFWGKNVFKNSHFTSTSIRFCQYVFTTDGRIRVYCGNFLPAEKFGN